MNQHSSRADILARVRAALQHHPASAEERRASVIAEIAAPPAGPRPQLTGDLVDRFCKRSLAMSSSIEQVASLAAAPAAIARYLAAGGLPTAAVCWQEYADLDWAGAGLSVEARAARDDDLVGITGTFCALAETGTLMLLSGSRTAATTSLLPETHIAIVDAARIVAGMEEGFALLRHESGERGECGELPRAVNFVSGPSRTGDIEQTIVLGAHGPYRVHLVIVGAGVKA
ncbi:lactate utilization protein C [Candidatus Accumulibacter phosphatis]|jgi:L-lactate dehydrogenase complex protein LldG|uniref:Lactate utilization protein C n=1 Tax=Candidatus Accumulibacter phosphatis TaxID=327160 RepID=A0ABX1TXP0_9PROT|nr:MULTISPECIES: lactate utilization protein C [Candidatus Accumulibacter]NMQ28146.1 lactate utilization protein C [Candidatus Accumulibacter phosphatis]